MLLLLTTTTILILTNDVVQYHSYQLEHPQPQPLCHCIDPTWLHSLTLAFSSGVVEYNNNKNNNNKNNNNNNNK
jgi:hypothetical protein